MIDNELDQLSRALIAATDRLNSQDFKDRQAKYVQMEQEFLTLGSELEAEERAVEKAQAALQQHVAVTYLDAAVEPADSDDGLFEVEGSSKVGTTAWYENIAASKLHVPTPDEELQYALRNAGSEDEFSTPRANGAYTD